MSEGTAVRTTWRIAGWWPWLILALAILPAVYRVLDYPSDIDPEYPEVFRPTFNRLPPLAYRLAEPGDRLDQLAICLAAGGIAIATHGLLRSRRTGDGMALWPAALAMTLGVFWYASIPTPSPDGWHGLGWESIVDRSAPMAQRLILAVVALGLVAVVGLSIGSARNWLRESWDRGFARGDAGLFTIAAILAGCRLAEIPAIEPAGYWPRWALVWSLLAWDIALIRTTARGRARVSGPDSTGLHLRRAVSLAGWPAAWGAIAAAGLAVAWYHRPLDRFKVIVPERVYISAMPTFTGLELADRRHRFKTIINLFPEDGPWRSPLLGDELKFAREHGIRYVGNPGDAAEPTAFIEKTLAVAQDPDAWPILVHCHACYDRTPAWVGIYRFVVQGRRLDGILRAFEQHRGSRPKASVTLLYNRVLAALAPERYAQDPTAQLLRHYAAGATLPTSGGRPSAGAHPSAAASGF
jgi:Tyrosine phosphatase family